MLALLLAGCAQAQAPEEALPGFTTNTALRAIDLSELDWLTPGMSRRVLEILRDEDSTDAFHLSPAMAVTVGRLLTGPIIEPTTTQAQRS